MKNKKLFIPLFFIIILSFALYLYFSNSSKKASETSNKNNTENAVKAVKDTDNTSNKTSAGSSADNLVNKETSSPDKASAKDITLINTTSNEIGNTPGNLLNMGQFAGQGKWMYYGDLDDVFAPPKIYRAMIDGETGFKPISNNLNGNIGCINVVGEWVYYINLGGVYKMKTDGTNLTKLPISSRFITVYGDWIYYVDQKTNFIYKIKTDSNSAFQVTSDATTFFNIDGGWIYYSNTPNGDFSNPQGLFKVKLDGTSKTKVTDDETSEFIVSNGWIYYNNFADKSFNKIKIDGSSKKTLMSFQEYLKFNISGEWIYYIRDTDPLNIYKMKTDGTSIAKMTNNDTSPTGIMMSADNPGRIYQLSGGINIIGDSIFIYCQNMTRNSIYRVKLDGSLVKFLK